ncbi:MAG: SIS domain-containing protein [Chloroflexota bacterium]
MTNNPIPENMRGAFERSEHPYHMWESLVSTPEALELVLASRESRIFENVARALSVRSMVHFIGCGTSFFNAQASAYAYQMLTGRPAVAHDAFEFVAYPPPDIALSAVVGVSHSGKTAATVDGVRLARAQGAVTIGYTDYEGTPLAQEANFTIYSPNPEKQGPKTRSYASSLLRSYLLSAALLEDVGEESEELTALLERAPQLTQQVLDEHRQEMEQLAERFADHERIVIIGGGPQVATAGETALKLIETALINADSWEIEEAVHGTWVCLEEGDLVVIIGTEGPSLEKAQTLVKGFKEIGVTLWGVTDVSGALDGADHETVLPVEVPEWYAPLFTMLPFYQFIYYYTLASTDLHPDRAPYVDPRYREARRIIRESTKTV